MKIDFFGLDELPENLENNALYFIENGTYAESYITSKTGTAKMVGNSVMIRAIADLAIAEAGGAGGSPVDIVADIDARNALAVGAEANIMALVLDATDDPTVDAGSALYAYSLAADTWYKVAEYESMDVVLKWADIQDKPLSTITQIDDAVTKKHSHANMAELNKISEDVNGNLLYDDEPVSTQWAVKDW